MDALYDLDPDPPGKYYHKSLVISQDLVAITRASKQINCIRHLILAKYATAITILAQVKQSLNRLEGYLFNKVRTLG